MVEQVGYKKPPRSGRFKKGQSGNRKGRPRGRQNVKKLASKMFDTMISFRIGNETVKLPYFEALGHVLKTRAMQGDAPSQRALNFLLEQLGYFDEKDETEPLGVLVVSRNRLTPEEWFYVVNQRKSRLAMNSNLKGDHS